MSARLVAILTKIINAETPTVSIKETRMEAPSKAASSRLSRLVRSCVKSGTTNILTSQVMVGLKWGVSVFTIPGIQKIKSEKELILAN